MQLSVLTDHNNFKLRSQKELWNYFELPNSDPDNYTGQIFTLNHLPQNILQLAVSFQNEGFELLIDKDVSADPDETGQVTAPGLTGLHILLVLLGMYWLERAPAVGPSFPFAQPLVRLVADIQAPYFVRYKLMTLIGSIRETFDCYAPVLNTEDIFLCFGHTQVQRYEAIERQLPGGSTLVDLGCGPAYYLCRLASRYQHLDGYDLDIGVLANARRKLKAANIKNFRLYTEFTSAAQVPPTADVLMSEVLEHMTNAEARRLLGLLCTCKANKMVFTVPNQEFNQHYPLEHGIFRHADHHWEPTLSEFKALMHEELGANWSLTFEPIGCQVKAVASGIMCVATPITVRPKPEATSVAEALFYSSKPTTRRRKL